MSRRHDTLSEVTTSAPNVRLIDALSGAKAPAKFFEANDQATARLADDAAMRTAIDVIRGRAERGAIAAKAQGHDDRALLDILAVIERIPGASVLAEADTDLNAYVLQDRGRLLRENVQYKRDLAAIGVEYDRVKRDRDKLAEVSDGLACAVDALRDARDEALIRADELHQSLNGARAEVVRLERELAQARAVEGWHGITSGGM